MSRRERYSAELENLELGLLLRAIQHWRGIDLPENAATPIRRRVWEAMRKEKVRTVSGLQEKLLHDPGALESFLKSVLPPFVPYSAGFLRKFRHDIVPLLRTYPFIRIWQIGCNSVFETYSLAIILLEEGLNEKANVYATDVNESFLQNCHQGVFSLAQLEGYEKIYKTSGGRVKFGRYFSGGGSTGIFDSGLRKNMVFSKHNLATDASFNEFNAIFCRNPLKHFDRQTRERAQGLVHESLVVFGILGLTPGETLENAPTAPFYAEFDSEYNLYRKIA
jgi:chemotaxis protein methyltransferase CheR